MFKKIFALFLALFAALSFASVDVNKASQAELESVKGIGPSISEKIVGERNKAPFKDWNDMVDRVGGVGPGNAAKFSAQGLTVNGATFSGTASPSGTVAKGSAGRKKAAASVPVEASAESINAADGASSASRKSKVSQKGAVVKEERKAGKASAAGASAASGTGK